jgi:hypothetical protein
VNLAKHFNVEELVGFPGNARQGEAIHKWQVCAPKIRMSLNIRKLDNNREKILKGPFPKRPGANGGVVCARNGKQSIALGLPNSSVCVAAQHLPEVLYNSN